MSAGEVANRVLIGCPFCGEAPELFPSPSGSGGDNYTLSHRCAVIQVYLAWRKLDTLVRAWNRRANLVTPSRDLPSEEGFFWWRENPEDAWRMVRIVDFDSGVEDKSHLMTYDVQDHAWSGRSLKNWAEYLQIGEWIHVSPPNTPDHPPVGSGASPCSDRS